jgi:hypothetical protein
MPVRKIPIGTRAVTGLHARSGVRYESSLERDFLELMMADSQVAEIDGQPITIHYIDQEKKARRHYTPDALVTFKYDELRRHQRPPLLVEVKYRDEYKKHFLEFKERIRAARRYAKGRGWQFKVVTEREIRTTRFTNMHFLAGFRDRTPDAAYVASITDHLAQVGATTPAALLTHMTADPWQQVEIIPTLWWMVAHTQLQMDLSTPLSMQSSISLPR